MVTKFSCVMLLATLTGVLAAQTTLTYPSAKKVDQTDDYHGAKIADPYRWLEDTDSADTASWVKAENQLTASWLADIPARPHIKQRLTELWDYQRYPGRMFERYAGMFQAGGRYFLFKNDGLQNQNVLYTMDRPLGPERVLLDPNKLSSDGTAALTGATVSHDGKLLAYAVSQSGSDWAEWRIRQIATGEDLSDLIQWTKFTSAEWTPDGSGFYYQRYPQPQAGRTLTSANTNPQVYHHRVGQPQSADEVIYERPDHKQWSFFSEVSDDGHYLVITIETGDAANNLLFYRDLRVSHAPIVELIPKQDALYNYVGEKDDVFFLTTTNAAPKGRLVAVDLKHPEPAAWKTILPEQSETLTEVILAGGRFVASYLKDAHGQTTLFNLEGRPAGTVSLPGIGTVEWSPARPSDRELFYSFTSFTAPTSIYRYDLASGASQIVKKSALSFDPENYQTEQIFYPSKDGTRIPMFLIHRKGIVRDGKNPALLYGYGGFNIAVTPTFNPATIDWMEMGGIFAVANLRGGSEYGEQWHQAGTTVHKQNVFDDFIAAAEWLIANRYTSTPKLAIYGGSNGGLLVGAVLNQRPDLFGAAMPAVGVMDMLRFQKFTVGAGWVGDYGSSDEPVQFAALRAYSPLHNIKPGGHYPPTLITTGDHDDRVVPGHSFKYAATLQAAQAAPAPILIRIETKAGHGAGKPTSKLINEYADRWAFLVKTLQMNPQ